MFPDARINFRRWSVSAETKIPIPVAITLHNFILPTERSSLATTRTNSPTTDHSRSSIHADNDNDNNDTTEDTSESPSSSPSKEEDAARRNRGMWLHRQPQHNSNLLPRLGLEITATPPFRHQKQQQIQIHEQIHEQVQVKDKGVGDNDSKNNKNNDKEGTSSAVAPMVVYSQHSPRTPSVHPSWEHLDERISIDKYDDWWNQNDLYKSMKVKLSVLSNPDKEGSQQQGTEDDCFIEAHLHPSFLERIDLGANNNSNNNNNNNTDDMDANSLLPPGLPPNAMLVHFSDGSIRCPPHIYQILWDNYGHSHGILDPPPVEDFSRFEDDVFATLDHVKQTPQRPRFRSVGSLLDQDQVHAAAAAAGVTNTNTNTNPHQNDDANHYADNSTTIDENGGSGYPPLPQDEGNASSPASEDQRQQESYPMTPPRPRRTFVSGKTGDFNNEITRKQDDDASLLFRLSEQDIVKEERRQEKLDLLRLISEEERALEDDLDCLKVEQRTLTNLMEQVQLVERDISRVHIELHKQSLKLEREEILKESQSIKLLRDLRRIYPITLDSTATMSSLGIIQSTRGPGGTAGALGGNNGYLIRGLRLPVDIYTTSISEEEVNTSLGYCAHLVFMVAKYLAIQLRYRIFCNGSRSAIEFDDVGIFPLFLGRLAARALEREQVDRGARLLGANVNCIMMHLDLKSSSSPSSPPRHILARLQTILDHVAEGPTPAINGKIP
jgi:hypothetical protein